MKINNKKIILSAGLVTLAGLCSTSLSAATFATPHIQTTAERRAELIRMGFVVQSGTFNPNHVESEDRQEVVSRLNEQLEQKNEQLKNEEQKESQLRTDAHAVLTSQESEQQKVERLQRLGFVVQSHTFNPSHVDSFVQEHVESNLNPQQGQRNEQLKNEEQKESQLRTDAQAVLTSQESEQQKIERLQRLGFVVQSHTFSPGHVDSFVQEQVVSNLNTKQQHRQEVLKQNEQREAELRQNPHAVLTSQESEQQKVERLIRMGFVVQSHN